MTNTENLGAGVTTPERVAGWLGARGMHVHPLQAGGKLPRPSCRACREGAASGHAPDDCRCIAAGRPCHGFRAASTKPAFIAAWWRTWPAANVGVACGPSGLVVIDLDEHGGTAPACPLPGIEADPPGLLRGGSDVLRWLCDLRGQAWPQTLTVTTPSGGLHLWFRALAPCYRSSAGAVRGDGTVRGLGWQIDVRAGGGYVVAPGSVTGRGEYRRTWGKWPPAELPGWLASELDRTGHRGQDGRPTGGGWDEATAERLREATRYGSQSARWAAAALAGECETLARLRSGAGDGINDRLNLAAFKLGQLVGAGLLSEAAVTEALTVAALATGHDPYHVARTIASGLGAGRRKPRSGAA